MARSVQSVAKELGISVNRIFNGKKYRLSTTARTKREANESAKMMRVFYPKGLARVVPVKGGKYVVYEKTG